MEMQMEQWGSSEVEASRPERSPEESVGVNGRRRRDCQRKALVSTAEEGDGDGSRIGGIQKKRCDSSLRVRSFSSIVGDLLLQERKVGC
ncbi:unnamed protein product [Lactuca virosa]|uniref:Uncharacterized protein n=1 Tax=Lactuca virosa TaxID=75947 RepID=A0AAU9NZS9_9ASTR|nr:unnamed protein product [Lactuca virosa]